MNKVHASLAIGPTYPTTPFEYNALENATTSVRLLRIREALVNGQIHCELQPYVFEKCPPYIAISYTWGSERHTTDISVNGSILLVRQNCADVLRQVHRYSSGYYWVDAICIDQGNDVEKTHQVKMMGAIFRRAKTVLACVGDHADDSGFLCEFLRRYESTLLIVVEELERSNSPVWPQFRVPTSIMHQVYRLATSIFWRLRFSLDTHRRVFAAVVEMLERPYFRRIWVAQELYMARLPMLLCGFDHCSMAALEGLLAISTLSDWTTSRSDAAFLYDIGYRFSSMPFWRRMFDSITRNIDPDGALSFRGTESTLAVPLRYAGSRNGLPEASISRMINTIHTLKCSDGRDMIYATVGMLDTMLAGQIRVDYHKTKTAFGVACDVVPLLIDEKAADGVLEQAIDMAGDPGLGELLQMLPLSPEDSLDESPEDPHYRHAIAARTGTEQLCSPWPTPSLGLRARVIINHWAGHQVHVPDHLPPMQPGVVQLHDEHGKPMALLPNETHNGDWLLESATPWSANCPGLILRQCEYGTMEVISTAIIIRSDYPGQSSTAFSVNFDAEDLTACMYHYTSFLGHARRPKVPLQAPLVGVEVTDPSTVPEDTTCSSDAISQTDNIYYAGYFRGKTPIDFADYFAVRPCYERMSSYGEALMTRCRDAGSHPAA